MYKFEFTGVLRIGVILVKFNCYDSITSLMYFELINDKLF
jgi:hypothetical protein